MNATLQRTISIVAMLMLCFASFSHALGEIELSLGGSDKNSAEYKAFVKRPSQILCKPPKQGVK